MADIVFVDLDGTLCDTRHRLHIVDKTLIGGDEATEEAMWRAYAEACPDDAVVASVNALIELLWVDCAIYLTSGRTESARALTEDWLETHDISYDELWMRPVGNRMSNGTLKGSWVAKARAAGHEVVLAIDDYHNAVKEYAALGVPCLHVHSNAGWDETQADSILVGGK